MLMEDLGYSTFILERLSWSPPTGSGKHISVPEVRDLAIKLDELGRHLSPHQQGLLSEIVAAGAEKGV